MRGKQELPKSLAIDSGVMLAYFLGEGIGKPVRDSLLTATGRKIYTSGIALAELFYTLCRRKGDGFAREAVRTLLDSGYVSVVSSDVLDMDAGRYKCARSVSLADCYILALAKAFSAAALFAKREDDLRRELERKPFDVEVLFLEDMADPRREAPS